MTPLALIVIACLSAEPDKCRSFTVAADAEITTDLRLPANCRTAMVEWAREHPAWRVTRWSCGRIERSA